MSGFNLRSIEQATSAEVAIKQPDGTPTGVVIEIAGPEHPERKRIKWALERKALSRYQKTGKVEMPDPEEAEASKHENLATYTLGWKGYSVDGVDVPFSKSAALDLYRDPKMAWLVDQIEAALGDKELFIKRSATT